MRRRRTGLLFAVAALLMFVVPALSSADENPIDQSEYGHLSGGLTQLLSPEGVGGGSLPKSTCTSTGDPAANVRLNCDSNTSPDNETPIVADPTNPNHLLAGSNDYFITQKGSGIQERVPTGFFTSFDGGHTWIDGQIPMGNGANGGNGDPSPAFDAKFGTAHMAQLSARIADYLSERRSHRRLGLDLVRRRRDLEAAGHRRHRPGVDRPVGDGDVPRQGVAGRGQQPVVAALRAAVPELGPDRAQQRRVPTVAGRLRVLGRRGQELVAADRHLRLEPDLLHGEPGYGRAGGACDESFFSYGGVEPNGDVVIGFINQQHAAAWEEPNEFEDQIMVVRSTDGGVHWSNPVHVTDLEDGGIEAIMFTDYPSNVDSRATQTGFQFRTGSWGNLNVDPVTGKVYVVWTDNSDGAHDVANPVTDTNVSMSVSSDEGATWSAPIRVTSGPSDKWFPWIAARGGEVAVLYQEEAGTGLYVTNLATSTNDGASWSYQTVSNAVSDADHSVWFQAHAADCATCSRFIGDYIGAAFDTLGRIHMTWTDMRRDLSIPSLGRTGKAEDDMYAQR